jgi:hypothetical protein
MTRFVALCFWLPLALCVACSSARPEAAALAASVDRFHRASNDQRPERAEAVAHVECRDPEVCDAKAVCLGAVSATAEALRLKREAELVLADAQRTHDATDPAVQALPDKLDRASRLLAKGHDEMPACDQKILVLRERYGL